MPPKRPGMQSDLSWSKQRIIRVSGILLAGLFIVWLPIEDVDTQYIFPLSVGLNIWLAANKIINGNIVPVLIQFTLAGMITGLLVTPMAIILIAFKSGLHAHGFPDFALIQIYELLATTPWWTLIGILVGAVFGWWLNRAAG